MKFKKIAVLVLILVGLLLIIHLINRHEEEKIENGGRLFQLKSENINKIELEKRGEFYRFVKKNTMWFLEKPIETRADKWAVESILDDFSSLKYERLVDKNVRDLKKFGLDKPEIELKLFESRAIKPAVDVQIGAQNQLDSSFYTRLRINHEVVLIASYKRDQLDKDLLDFRDKKLCNFGFIDDVRALKLIITGKEFYLKKRGDDWFLEIPVLSLVRETGISDILSLISQLEAKEFVVMADVNQLRVRGFDHPVMELSLVFENSTRILKVAKKDNRFYALAPDIPEICEIEPEFFEKFPKEVKDFREYKVSRFYSFDVRKVLYQDREMQISFSRDREGRWKWAKPVSKAELDGEKVNQFLSIIENLEAESFVDHPSGKEDYSSLFEVWLGDEKENKKMEIIHLSFSDGPVGTVLVKNRDLPYLFRISKKIREKFPKKMEDFIKKEGPGIMGQ